MSYIIYNGSHVGNRLVKDLVYTLFAEIQGYMANIYDSNCIGGVRVNSNLKLRFIAQVCAQVANKNILY